MDIAQIIEWLDKYNGAIASTGLIVSGLWTVWIWKKKTGCNSDAGIQNLNSSNDGKQINAPVTANGHAKVIQNFGDNNNYPISDEAAEKIANILIAKISEAHDNEIESRDAQIKSLKETMQALPQQDASKYDIQQALKLLAQGDTTQAEAIFEGVAEDARSAGKQANIKEAEALRHLGLLAFLHDTQKALTVYKRSTELDPDNMDGWNQLGHLYRRTGELENAENAYMAVLKLADHDQIGQAVAYGNLGNICRIRSELDQAIEYYNKSLAISNVLGNKKVMANNYGNLGNVYQIRGELDRAIEYFNKSLAISEALGDKEGIANQYGNQGNVYRIRGELDRAIEYYNKSLAISEALGDKEVMASNYVNQGNVYRVRGELDRAIEYFNKSLAISEALGSKEVMAYLYGSLGNVYRICGELDRAIEHYNKSLAISEALGNKEVMASNYASLGGVYQTRGELDQAIEHYNKALSIDEALGRKEGMANNYGNLGNVYRVRGELDRAVEYYKKSLALFTEVCMKPQMAQAQSLLDSVQSAQ